MVATKELPVSLACQALQVSRSGFYAWQKREPRIDNVELLEELQKVALEFSSYGYRRVTKELHRRGLFFNHKRILRLMRRDNLLCIRKKYKPVTTQSNHSLPVYLNLVKGIEVTGLNQVWVSDITYIHLLTEFIYLAVILDLYSRKVIGWALSRNIDAELTLAALQMALTQRQHLGLNGLIHHSDQGVQYAATQYVDKLKEHDVRASMSRKANPYDNAFAESFMKTLKTEEVNVNEYESFEQAYADIERFIERVYNAKRLHSSLGYVPPNEFEQLELKRIKTLT